MGRALRVGSRVVLLEPDFDSDDNGRERHVPAGTVGRVLWSEIGSDGRRHGVGFPNGASMIYDQGELGRLLVAAPLLRYPARRILGLTWAGWLNFLILQWFGFRLAGARWGTQWRLLGPVAPLTGWWTDYWPASPRVRL